MPTFHGYSASGNVTAQYVYCNYGTYEDFAELQKAEVELEGKIALVKYGGIFRGLKVKRAEELGMVGAVIYSDPGDDGLVTEANGYEPYPKGPARNPSSVQRGSVEYLCTLPLMISIPLRKLTVYPQPSRQATQPRSAIPPSLEFHANPPKARSPRFPPCPSPTPTHYLYSPPSTPTARPPPPSQSTGTLAAWPTKTSPTTSAPPRLQSP